MYKNVTEKETKAFAYMGNLKSLIVMLAWGVMKGCNKLDKSKYLPSLWMFLDGLMLCLKLYSLTPCSDEELE